MSNSSGTEERPSGSDHNAPSPSRRQLEQLLDKALEEGSDALPRQLRSLLALSQKIGAVPFQQVYREPVLTVPHARLSALIQMADTLRASQIRELMQEVAQVREDGIRLPLLVDLVRQLEAEDDDGTAAVHDAWRQALRTRDPVVRSRTLIALAPILSVIEEEPESDEGLLEIIAQAQSIKSLDARVRSLVALAPHLPGAMSGRILRQTLEEIDSNNNSSLQSSMIRAMVGYLPEELEAQALHSAQMIKAPLDRAHALIALASALSFEYQPSLKGAALEAIADIETEEDRANTLIAFSPFLEYAGAASDDDFPKLLEGALKIAISIQRRHIRVRTLVALAPHLTPDLKGEALAAVHSLELDSERVNLLAQLAPTLAPDMLVASLAVAHTMREPDARVHALILLARHVPEHARTQTQLDALNAAAQLQHHYERVTTLIELGDILPDDLRTQAYTKALDTAREIDKENARARALSLLAQHLPVSEHDAVIEIAMHISDPEQRLNALVGIAPSISEARRSRLVPDMLACADALPFEFKQARALVSIAPHLPAERLAEALLMADSLEDPYDKVSVLIALAQNSPPDDRPSIINRAWPLTSEIEDGYDRATTLTAIAPFVSEVHQDELADLAMAVIGDIEEDYDRASAVSILAPLLTRGRSSGTRLPDGYNIARQAVLSALVVPFQAQRARLLGQTAGLWNALQPDARWRLWREFAPRLATRPLPDVLLCLGALMPVLRALYEDRDAEAIAHILGMR